MTARGARTKAASTNNCAAHTHTHTHSHSHTATYTATHSLAPQSPMLTSTASLQRLCRISQEAAVAIRAMTTTEPATANPICNLEIDPTAGAVSTVMGGGRDGEGCCGRSEDKFPAVALMSTGGGKRCAIGRGGGTTVTAGTLQIGSITAMGSGGLTANGGFVDLAGFSPALLDQFLR